MRKLFDLSPADFRISPVWYFPVDECGDDGDVVLPAGQQEVDYGGEMIVYTLFKSAHDLDIDGYIYWENTPAVSCAKPTVFIDGEAIHIHRGAFFDKDHVRALKERLDGFFPMRFESQECYGLAGITGIVEGLYCYDMSARGTRLIK